MTYTLTLVYLDGTNKEIILAKPHVLSSQPVGALVWEDAEGNSHNVMLASLREFYFHPVNYNLCAEWNNPKLEAPTPGCNCDVCKQRIDKIKKLAAV